MQFRDFGPRGEHAIFCGFRDSDEGFLLSGRAVMSKNWTYSSVKKLASDSKPHCDHQTNSKDKTVKIYQWGIHFELTEGEKRRSFAGNLSIIVQYCQQS